MSKREEPRRATEAPVLTTSDRKGNVPAPNSLQPIFYNYTDELDQVLFREVRHHPKRFQQQAWDPMKEVWLPRLGEVRRVLYHLPEVIAGVNAGRTTYIVEGCKDVESLRATGRIATCNPGGTGMSWKPEYNDWLGGGVVIVVQDKDPAGHEHALKIAASLKPVAQYVTVMESRFGNDVSDSLAAGKGFALRAAQPYVRPTSPKAPVTHHHGAISATPTDAHGVWAVLKRLAGVEGAGPGQWMASCPAHQDDRISLKVSIGTKVGQLSGIATPVVRRRKLKRRLSPSAYLLRR